MSAEPDYLPADALAEEEPKYLRRQKPVEIRKRKFSRKAWPLYRRGCWWAESPRLPCGFVALRRRDTISCFPRRAAGERRPD